MIMSKKKDMFTAEEFYQAAKDHYKLAVEFEDTNAPQNKIDACWGVTAQEFWWALVLGSEKAPLALFKCFWQGLGVKKDDDIATLMYGVALKFTPQDCAKLPADSRPAVPDKAMKSRIDDLEKLVKKAYKAVPNKGITMEKVFDQMHKFDKAIKLPGGKSIEKCFTEKTTAATYDEHGASTSAHDTSADSGLHDTSFDEGNVAMGGESSHYPHHH
jgi:hypothetical protein